jgi:hypothetical protein
MTGLFSTVYILRNDADPNPVGPGPFCMDPDPEFSPADPVLVIYRY